RALHFAARRFFAPALASIHVPGEEEIAIGNYRRSSVEAAHLHTVYDAPAPARGLLRWDLLRLDGKVLLRGRLAVALRHGRSVRHRTLRLGPLLRRHGRDNVVLRLALDIGGRCVSETSAFLAPPRFVALPKARTTVAVALAGPRRARLTFASDAFQHCFAFDLAGVAYQADDNYFDLYPREARTIEVALARPRTAAQVRAALTYRSLVDAG